MIKDDFRFLVRDPNFYKEWLLIGDDLQESIFNFRNEKYGKKKPSQVSDFRYMLLSNIGAIFQSLRFIIKIIENSYIVHKNFEELVSSTLNNEDKNRYVSNIIHHSIIGHLDILYFQLDNFFGTLSQSIKFDADRGLNQRLKNFLGCGIAVTEKAFIEGAFTDFIYFRNTFHSNGMRTKVDYKSQLIPELEFKKDEPINLSTPLVRKIMENLFESIKNILTIKEVEEIPYPLPDQYVQFKLQNPEKFIQSKII